MSSDGQERLEADPLFLGMTRPAMVFGVTWSSFVLNVMLSTVVFLVANDLRGFLVFVPVHVVSTLLCLRDARIFDLLLVRVSKTPPVPNERFWRARSYSPSALRRSRASWA